jgi:transposase
MTDFLHFPNLRSTNVVERSDHYDIQAEGGVEPTRCPACYSSLYRHGSQEQMYMDAPVRGKPVKIRVNRKRFRCKACGKTIYEPLPEIDAKRYMTERLISFIEDRCLKDTFADVSREVGVDSKTIRHIFDDYVARLKREVTYETPRVLGIDEIKIIGDYRATVTNIEKLSLFDLLPTRKKAHLLDYFRDLPDKKNIQVVTMDLWSVYRQVVAAQLPGRMVVADKFHVLRMANNALESVRKKVRRSVDDKTRLKLKNDRFLLLKRYHELNDGQKDKLRDWAMQFPALGVAHAVKEGFFAIYDQPTKASAEAEARAWLTRIDPIVAKEFREASVALRNWWQEIFAWYDFPVTNAYTESFNRLVKDANRMGRGYSFDVIRAKLLFDKEARKTTTGVIRKRVRREKITMDFMDFATESPTQYEFVIEERKVEYGPHIPTLCDLLESGHFS